MLFRSKAYPPNGFLNTVKFQTIKELRKKLKYYLYPIKTKEGRKQKEQVIEKYGYISDWKFAPGITIMSKLFEPPEDADPEVLRYLNLNKWDTSNVTDMSSIP